MGNQRTRRPRLFTPREKLAEGFRLFSRRRGRRRKCARPGSVVYAMEAHRLTRSKSVEPVAGRTRAVAVLRRAFDLVVGLALILLLSPILIAVALAVRIDSHGPALFRQRRVGYREREFTLFKFRSMRVDADPRGHREYVTALIKGERSAPEGGARGRPSTSSPSTTG